MSSVTIADFTEGADKSRFAEAFRRYPTVVVGAFVLVVMVIIALIAPLISIDPVKFNPIDRLNKPFTEFLFGTDHLGRDIFSRTVHGGRVSLVIGFSVALLASILGLFVGLVSGYVRAVDAVLMRIMDGLMAIPEILLAIALIAVTGATIQNVIIAITVPEVPRVARLVRSIVLSIREQPYVEAAVSIGTRTPKIILRHVLPNTMAPLLVQATYVCASAVITEALLGFIGAGTPPEIPSWGNVMAEGRRFFQLAPWIIFFPGIFLATTVLAVNIIGDGLRDMLDPRLARQMK
ncbi:MAG: ABC transporter permease [Gammaproteobacteria bacterium]|nr:ABC transporter permease [Gammaproteobacteria bacterium]